MTFSNAKGTDINVTDTTMPSCIKCYCFSTFPSLLCSRSTALVQASVSSPHAAPRNDFPGLTLSVRCVHGPGPGHRLMLQRTRCLLFCEGDGWCAGRGNGRQFWLLAWGSFSQCPVSAPASPNLPVRMSFRRRPGASNSSLSVPRGHHCFPRAPPPPATYFPV